MTLSPMVARKSAIRGVSTGAGQMLLMRTPRRPASTDLRMTYTCMHIFENE